MSNKHHHHHHQENNVVVQTGCDESTSDLLFDNYEEQQSRLNGREFQFLDSQDGENNNFNNTTTTTPFRTFANNFSSTSTFHQYSAAPHTYSSIKSQQKAESNNNFTLNNRQVYANLQGEMRENSHTNPTSLAGGGSLFNNNHHKMASSSFEKRDHLTGTLFKENPSQCNNNTELMTNDFMVFNNIDDKQGDYSFISEEEEEEEAYQQHQQQLSNNDMDESIIQNEEAELQQSLQSDPPPIIIPNTTINSSNLFNVSLPQQEQRPTRRLIQRSRSLSMQNSYYPLRRDANHTSIDLNIINNHHHDSFRNNNQQAHLYSPLSSNSSVTPPQSQQQPQPPPRLSTSSSTEGLTNAPIIDNSYQQTSSLHSMHNNYSAQSTSTNPKDIFNNQNKVKKTKSRSFHSRDNMELLSDSMMMMDSSNNQTSSYQQQHFGFNNHSANNGNNYSPTSSGGSMEQSPPTSPLAAFLSQIDFSKLNQEQLAALQVLCMSNQNNLTTSSSLNEIISIHHHHQRRSSVAGYMSDDSSSGATQRDSLLKTVLQKQLHTNNEVVDENQELYSMIDSALSGCKSSLGLKLVANEIPVNNFPTRTTRTFSSPPQFQITPTRENVSPMSRSSEETIPTIEISNNDTNTFNFGSFGSEYEQQFENNPYHGVGTHQRHNSSPAINTFVNRVEKPAKTKRKSSSVKCNNNASSSTGHLEQTLVASAVSAVASSSTSASKKGSRRNSISSTEQPILIKQNKSPNYNKTIVFNNYYDEIQFKKKYGPNSTFYKFK